MCFDTDSRNIFTKSSIFSPETQLLDAVFARLGKPHQKAVATKYASGPNASPNVVKQAGNFNIPYFPVCADMWRKFLDLVHCQIQ